MNTREIFNDSGPMHLLTSFDWPNLFYRTSVAASLVQGAYNLEHDRQGGSTVQEHYAHSSQWWESFNFQLREVLKDEVDLSFFGAIYELKAHPSFYIYKPHPPRYVIAFRGTLFKSATNREDMKLNMKYAFDKLQNSPRFRTAFEMVWKVVENVGAASVWLAGHSLGAAIAMLAGKNMAKAGFHLETFLFNPPFISVPLETLTDNGNLKLGVRITGSFMTAGIATTMNLQYHKDPEEDQFNKLSEWTPYLFVNPSDPICAEYIGYFQHREKTDCMGFGKIGRIATKYSTVSLVSGVMGRDSEPSHLLPTACIYVNRSEKFKEAHGIHQWWQKFKKAHGIQQWWQDFQWESKLCKFDAGPSVEKPALLCQNEHNLGYRDLF